MLKVATTEDKIQLYCFPFAGASFYSYNSLLKTIPKKRISITSLELPGRGRRAKEPLLSDINDMADDLFDRIRDKLTSPYAFYGHSMGSILAYEVLLRVIKNNLALPNHLFVSGRGGPPVVSKHSKVSQLSKSAFYELLKDYGGTTVQILQDKNLMDFFEPVLRADFTAAGCYKYSNSAKTEVPVSVFYSRDETITEEESLTWQAITDPPISIRYFSGGHFFIFDHAGDICKAITNILCGELICEPLTFSL